MHFDIFKKDGTVLDDKVVEIKASNADLFQFTVVHRDGASASGLKVTVNTDGGIIPIAVVDGHLNAQGKLVNSVGPSFGYKGDMTLTIHVGKQAKPLPIRFTD